MAPIRMLSKDFIGSMLSAQKQEMRQKEEPAEPIETMLISDDEDGGPESERIIRRKQFDKEERAIKERGIAKKEALSVVERQIASLKLDVIDDFEI